MMDFLREDWYQSFTYDANKSTGMVVCGDFDHDGFRDDIGAFYYYGNNQTSLHVWFSNGSSFQYGGIKWTSTSYNGNKQVGTVLAGDFDRDGWYDDIVMFYDYGNFRTKAHVLTSTSQGYFTYRGIWYDSGAGNFDASRIKYRMASGDFDRDGRNDDIVAFYSYNNQQTKAFVWHSTGSAFTQPSAWYDSGAGNFNGDKIIGKVVSGDFDGDNYADDVAAIYVYDAWLTKTFLWKSTGSTFSGPSTAWNHPVFYKGDLITGRVVSGNFDGDGEGMDDIVGMHKLLTYSNPAIIQMWRNAGGYFNDYQNWWEVCPMDIYKTDNSGGSDVTVQESDIDTEMKVFPNPTSGVFNVELSSSSTATIEVFGMDGRLVHSQSSDEAQRWLLDLSSYPNGIYVVKLTTPSQTLVQRVMKD